MIYKITTNSEKNCFFCPSAITGGLDKMPGLPYNKKAVQRQQVSSMT